MRLAKPIVVAAFGVVTLMALAVTASATPSSGFTGDTQVRGTLPNHIRANADGVKFQTSGAIDVVVQTITVTPGGFSGWHTHPGVVLVVVQQGTVTQQVGCSIHTYSVGQSFYESGLTPGIVRNLTARDFVVRVTFIVPKGAAVRRDVLAKDAPQCGPEEDQQQQD